MESLSIAAATSRMGTNKRSIQTDPSGSSGSGSSGCPTGPAPLSNPPPSGVKVNTHVPGHRQTYKDAGISKQQIRAGRTRDNQQTPVQEHQARAAGIIVEPKIPPDAIHLDKQCMKDLMDWMWRTRHEKFANSLSEDKLWAPAGAIPRQMRPKMSQLEQYDWVLQNPYPGWKLAIDQGASGWKCKLVTDDEFCLFSVGVGRSVNPKSIARAKAAGPRTDEQKCAGLRSKVNKGIASTPSEDPVAEVAINFEYVRPSVDGQLRNTAEKQLRNPLMVKDEGDTIESMHAYQVAAHRWNLLTDFASSQISDALRENSRAAMALMELFPTEDLSEIKGHLRDVRWGHNRKHPDALQADIDSCRSVLTILRSKIADLMRGQDENPGLRLDVHRNERVACVFEDILRIKIKHQRKQQGARQMDEVPAGASSLSNLGPTPQPHQKRKWADSSSSSDDESSEDGSDKDFAERGSVHRMTCMAELGVSRDELNKVMLSLFEEIGILAAYCSPAFLAECIPAKFEGTHETASAPRQVTPLHDNVKYPPPEPGGGHTGMLKRPSVFVLTSTNPQTKRQWTETYNDLTCIGLEVIPVLGLDGERVPCMSWAWRRAQMAWALTGLPFINKCINMTPMGKYKDWFIIAEDSARLSPLPASQRSSPD